VGAPENPLRPEFSLRITEIMYHPHDLDLLDGDRLEFIELYNARNVPIDLSGYYFSDGIRFSFAEGIILDPDSFLVVAKDIELFSQRYDPATMAVIAGYDGSLDNGGESIVLSNAQGEPVIRFRYDDLWYQETDGEGYSLVLRDRNGIGADLSGAGSWRASYVAGGSPGRADAPLEGGLQLPGDVNQDGRLDISDCVGLLRLLFAGAGQFPLPCEGDSVADGGNLTVLDNNADGSVDIADGIYVLNYLFSNGPPPARGTTCIVVEGCQSSCVP
jgi:hypothetical protein